MKLVNLTPHDIRVFYPESAREKGYIYTIEKSGIVARLLTEEKIVGYIPIPIGWEEAEEFNEVISIPVKKIKYISVEGLPKPKPETLYIVSSVVREALRGIRDDVISPDTGKSAIRDDGGNIIGVTAFLSTLT